MMNQSVLRYLLLAAISLCGVDVYAHDGHEHGTTDRSTRAWTLRDVGAHVHGSYVASVDGKVQIRRTDGKIVSLEISTLVEEDQKWIEQKVAQVRAINENVKLPAVSPKLIAVNVTGKATIADSFEPFAKLNALKYRQDAQFFYVESNSMPDHRMMVGITAWQRQVPIPQPYSGNNAWRIPLEPVVAKNPLSAKSHFFRGAIALAANGVPIFNPIKNDGRTDTLVAGELDEFGGHCGRADDYHYHIAPTHLQEIVGKGVPIAYALDGYPIYGYTEPDGSEVRGLDAFNGHTSPDLGYHYHATKTYPYLNGGFHGEVKEVGGQVDPQPRTGGVREALTPWRGAKITGFETKDDKSFSVKVQVGKETYYINYVLNDNGSVKFDFIDNKGNVKTETYSPRQQGRGGPGGGRRGPGGAGQGGGRGGPGGAGGAGPGGSGRGEGANRGGPGGGNRPPRDDNARGDRPPRDEQGAGAGRRPPQAGNADGRGRTDGNRPPGRPGDRPSDRPGEGRRGEESQPATPPLIIDAKKTGAFKLTSPALVEGQPLPDEFNGNGEGATPPLEWKGAPEGTKSFALVMDHIDRDNYLKTYWNLYGIPSTVTILPKNAKGIGKVGATWKRDQAYVPPHSAGGGKQTYTLHVYALSIVPEFDESQGPVTREALLTKIKDHILDSSDLNVTYQRPAGESDANKRNPGGPGGGGGPDGGRGARVGQPGPRGQGGQGGEKRGGPT